MTWPPRVMTRRRGADYAPAPGRAPRTTRVSNADGGQLFRDRRRHGRGGDRVPVPHAGSGRNQLLAGREPGPLAVSRAFLFVASPGSGGVSILEINSRKVIAVASVAWGPGFITVTPDDQYALVPESHLGRYVRAARGRHHQESRPAGVTADRDSGGASRPVSAVVRAV